MRRICNPLNNASAGIFLLLAAALIALTVTFAVADVQDRTPPRGTVPNPGTQQQELANITAPAPYNVFEFVVTCAACHGGTIDQNAGHFGNWAGTSMASAARDPIFRANQIGVNNAIRAVTGENGAGNMCMRCHSPNGWLSGRFDPTLAGDPEGRTMEHSILASTDDEGILCEACHRTMGNVTFKKSTLAATDPVWNMMSGISDWPHLGKEYLDQAGSPTIADQNPYGDTTLQFNDGMLYVGKYSGSVDLLFSDTPLADTNYTGQTYGVLPTGAAYVAPDGSRPLHYELPIGPPLDISTSTYDYEAQSISLEHPTAGDRPDPPGLLPQPVPPGNSFLRSSEFCGSCHDLVVPILNHGMPEQRTYTEWKFSDFGTKNVRCQDCHMPTQKHEYADDVPVSLNPDPALAGWFPYGKDRNPDGGTAFHKFTGANRDLPMMMKELYPEVDLEVIGASTGNDTRIFPGMLSHRDPMYDRAQRNSEISLHDGVDVAIDGGPSLILKEDPNDANNLIPDCDPTGETCKWEVAIKVTNNSGHRVPSGYPDGRRFWIELQVTDNGAPVYLSGHYDEAEAELLTEPGVFFNRALEPVIDTTDGQPNAVMVYERVTGTCVDDADAPIFPDPDPTKATPASCSATPSLLNNFILFDNRIMPRGFNYAALRESGVKLWNYDPASMVPYEDFSRYTEPNNFDTVTYRFDGPPVDAALHARAEIYWQTHTREFMEHLRDQDTSTVRPEGPPSIYEANYPLTPNYLSDQIGLADIIDPYNLDGKGKPIPLSDNWGGIAYGSWLLTGKGAPYLVAVADSAAVLPGEVTGLTVTPLDLFTLQLNWDAMDGAEGYMVWVSLGLADNTATWDKLAVVYGTSFTHEALNVGKSYRYAVQAFNGAGYGPNIVPATDAVTGTTPMDVPLAPENLSAYWSSSKTIALSWYDMADNEDSFIIQRQDVPVVGDFYTIAEMISQTAGGATGGNSFIDGDKKAAGVTWDANYVTPKPGSTYNYRVAAVNITGMSTWSLPTQAVTGGPPGAPTNLVAAPGAGTSVDLSWDAATGIVEGYRLERGVVAFGQIAITWSILATLAPDQLSYNDATVDPASTYYYRVFAFNAASGDSLPSNVASITIGVPAPANPTNLTASLTKTVGQIELSWTDNADSESGYYVERAADPNPTLFTVIGTTDANTSIYQDTPTVDGTYHYRVQAFIANVPPVVSNYSNVATIVTPLQIPEAPAELTVTKIAKTSITLGWLDKSTNEEKFEILQVDPPNTFTVGPNVTTFTDSSLIRKTTYTYQVRACNVAGCSAYSASASGTTK